jgi:hypothetical protein
MVGPRWEGEVMGKGGRKVNTVQKCVHMYVNAKIILVQTIQRIGRGGGTKENSGGGEFKYDIFDTLTTYPTHHNNKGKNEKTIQRLN